MKFRQWILVPILGAIVLAGAALPNYFSNPNPEKEKLLIQAILDGLKELHYEPQAIDDAYSQRVYELYLKRLDGGKRFLTQADIKQLAKFENKLDDDAKEGNFEFLDLSVELFEKRKTQVKAFYAEILAQPFDFEKEESIETDAKKVDYPKNEKELKDLWRKSLKLQVMTRVADQLAEQEAATERNDTAFAIKSFEAIEQEAREKVLKSHDDWFQRMTRIDREDRLSTYLNAITAAYDPHTNYFPPQDKENFDISMSGTLEGIGARLQEDGKYIKVVSIVPGSPSWKQGELEVGDKILAVAQSEGEAVDAADMAIDDVVEMIRGKKGTEVRLTVKKRDNTTQIIPIIRDVVVIEESYAKSAILDHGGQRIGYIHLPKFYTDFRREGSRRCATDVKEELSKLKEDNVNGIILDLRNNGGGSLADVVEMGGLFIDEGPIVQVKPREGNPRILSDDDPSVHYDGPLVIMVNAFSASASEILAAAMQDYGRAIIVGSSPTFGKGTVQQFIDLDRIVPSYYKAMKPLGAVKLTTQKFYRIDGGTTQLKGVEPDIVIPDDYTYIEVGEKEEDFALGWDEISAAKYASVNKLASLNELQSASSSRVLNDAALAAIDENAKKLKERRENTAQTLNLAAYREEVKTLQEESNRLKKFDKTIEGLAISIPSADVTAVNADESRKARMDEWHKTIKKDLQLKETLAIMRDMIQ